MKHVCWLSGPLHIEERLNEGPRLQLKHIDENEAQQNKRNTRERHHDIYKPNARRIQVHCSRYLYIIIYRAWYKISRTTLKKREREKNVLFSVLLFFPLLTDYYLTSTSPLGLGYPLLAPSRHVRAYDSMPLSSLGFLCSDPFCHEMFHPLFLSYVQLNKYTRTRTHTYRSMRVV